MPITPSTPEEILACEELVRRTGEEVRRLQEAGKKVHFVWDVDGVLVSSRSDDAFAVLGHDVARYFTYEERLLAEILEDGPWSSFARGYDYRWDCPRPDSQDIVTARSSYVAMRVQFWLLNWMVPTRWQLYVGHQSKADSYRIILKSFLKNPDVHVFMVDDGERHVLAFREVAEELGMADRCHGIWSPAIRKYDEETVRREVEGVMDDGDQEIHDVAGVRPGPKNWVTVLPQPRKTLQEMWSGLRMKAHKKSVVNNLRPALEKMWRESWPNKEPTDDDLFFVYELLKEPR